MTRAIPRLLAQPWALIGNMSEMNPKYIRGAVYEGYGTSMFVGVGILIPTSRGNDGLCCGGKQGPYTNVIDYSVPKKAKPSLKSLYAELRSGSVDINGSIKTSPLSSLKMAREIAEELNNWIKKGEFFLQEPIQSFPMGNSLKGLEIKEGESR